MLTRFTLASGLLLGFTSSALAPNDARAIVERAVKAHGGEERLSKLRASRVKVKGKVIVGEMEVPFTAETTVQLPNKFRVVVQATVMNKTRTVTQVLNGDRGWISIDGQTREPSPAELTRMKDLMYVDGVVRLLPLLQGKGFELTLLKESRVNDRPVQGIRVSSKGFRDVNLFFDKDSGLLIKTERTVTNEQGRDVMEEEFHSEFRDVDGYKRPTKIVVFQDGKKITEGELIDVKNFDSLPESEFGKP
jgi:hypothetical protein